MKHSFKRTRKQSQRRSRALQQGGAIFTTEEKDNLINNGGFTYEQLDYLGTLPNDFRRLFGSPDRNDYNFIKSWQTSVSNLYDIPPTPENMKEIAYKTIEDFKYFFERRNPQFAQDGALAETNNSVNLDTNISSASFGGRRKRKYTRRRSSKKH